jgi:hypothetical protein
MGGVYNKSATYHDFRKTSGYDVGDDFGARLLTAGMSLPKVEEMCVWKGLNPATIEKIKHHAKI